jgi:hypothetical protein
MTYYYDSQVAHNDKVMGVKIKDNPDGFPHEFLKMKNLKDCIWHDSSLIYHDEKNLFSMGTHFFLSFYIERSEISSLTTAQLFHRPFKFIREVTIFKLIDIPLMVAEKSIIWSVR